MATDTAFAVALIVLMGSRVPVELRIFLTAAAIVDDIGAIIVVALFYSGALHAEYLIAAGVVAAALALLQYWGVYRVTPYVVLGVLLWALVHEGGLHATLAGVVLAALASLGVGFWLQRTRSRLGAWLFVVATVGVSHVVLLTEPAGFRMLALLVVACCAMKVVVGVEAHRADGAPLPFGRWLAFAAIWFGMQPREFAVPRLRRAALRLALTSAIWVAAGALVIAAARALAARLGAEQLRAPAYLFLVGCSMVLHFGVIGLCAAGLRAFGFDVHPQFRAPWRSRCLQEFWARRWNVGFSVMTTIAIYRPTVRRLGRTGSLVLGFAASGLLHELACSLPVLAGFGLPMAYFALHGVAIAAERVLERRGVRLRGLLGAVWVYGWVLLPAPLLFHGPFLRGIVLPLL
jgi:alginate O-acetyltransferase complex protein AlgI